MRTLLTGDVRQDFGMFPASLSLIIGGDGLTLDMRSDSLEWQIMNLVDFLIEGDEREFWECPANLVEWLVGLVVNLGDLTVGGEV